MDHPFSHQYPNGYTYRIFQSELPIRIANPHFQSSLTIRFALCFAKDTMKFDFKQLVLHRCEKGVTAPGDFITLPSRNRFNRASSTENKEELLCGPHLWECTRELSIFKRTLRLCLNSGCNVGNNLFSFLRPCTQCHVRYFLNNLFHDLRSR